MEYCEDDCGLYENVKEFIDTGIKNIFNEKENEYFTINILMIDQKITLSLSQSLNDVINYNICKSLKTIYIEASYNEEKNEEFITSQHYDKYSYFRNYSLWIFYDEENGLYTLIGCYKCRKERDLIIYFSQNFYWLLSFFLTNDKKYRINPSVSIFGKENIKIMVKNTVNYHINKKAIISNVKNGELLINFIPNFKGMKHCCIDDPYTIKKILLEANQFQNFSTIIDKSLNDISSLDEEYNDFIADIKAQNYSFVDINSQGKMDNFTFDLDTLYFLIIVFDKVEVYFTWLKNMIETGEINLEDSCFIYKFFDEQISDTQIMNCFMKILENMLNVEIPISLNDERIDILSKFDDGSESLHFLVEKFVKSHIEFIPLISFLFPEIDHKDEKNALIKLDEIYANEKKQEILELFLRTIMKILQRFEIKQLFCNGI